MKFIKFKWTEEWHIIFENGTSLFKINPFFSLASQKSRSLYVKPSNFCILFSFQFPSSFKTDADNTNMSCSDSLGETENIVFYFTQRESLV